MDLRVQTPMPKLRRGRLPQALLDHLAERIREREITAVQVGLMADWVASNPEVPTGRWYKCFGGMAVCGEGELIKTFLRQGQVPTGEEL
jgi:hypothetical protein